MSADPTAAPGEERELWEDAWDVLNAAHLAAFEYAHNPSRETFEALIGKIAEGRRQVADVLGVRIESLESQLAAATARVREVEAERDALKTDAERYSVLADAIGDERITVYEGDETYPVVGSLGLEALCYWLGARAALRQEGP